MRASDFEKSETDGQEVGTRVAFFYQSRGPCARKGGVWTVWRLCALLPRDRYFSGQRRSTRSRPESDTTVYSKCQSREGRTITGETLGRIRPPARKESVQRLCFQFVDISHNPDTCLLRFPARKLKYWKAPNWRNVSKWATLRPCG